MFRLVQQWWNLRTDLCRVCLVTGTCALGISLIGVALRPFVGNWFHATGLAMVGLFYLVLGLTSWPPRGASAVGAADVVKYFGPPIERRRVAHLQLTHAADGESQE